MQHLYGIKEKFVFQEKNILYTLIHSVKWFKTSYFDLDTNNSDERGPDAFQKAVGALHLHSPGEK